MKRFFLLLTFLISFFQSMSQNLTFSHLTVDDGLSHNAVLAIAQDRQGFMWFGTGNGLSRYDGHSIRVYKSNPADSSSILSNSILSILSDSKGTLWVGTSGGLHKYDPRRDAFKRIETAQFRDKIINTLYEDKKGSLWAGTNDGLFLLIDRQKNTFRAFHHSTSQSIASNNVHSIYEDHKGDLWIGTSDGLTRMKYVKGNWQYETFRHKPDNTSSLAANYITSITADAHKNLWIGTQNNGIDRYDPATNSFSHFLQGDDPKSGLINNKIREIVVDKRGSLWIGTQEGLNVMDPVSKKIRSYQHSTGNKKSLSQNSIHSLYQDANGSIWVGTYFGGVNVTYSFNTPFSILQDNGNHSGISNNVISSIVEDEKQNLWIGTEGGGLNYYNRASGLFTVYKNIPDDPSSLGSNLVKVVYRDRDGNVWAGTHGGGLNLFDPLSRRFKRFLFKANDAETLNGEVVSLLDDSEGRFWVSSNKGLKIFRRNKTSLELAHNSLIAPVANQLAKALLEDSKKRIWIGTASGLYVLVNNKIKEAGTGYNINCILEDRTGRIWLGLNGNGLALFDEENNKFVRYTENEDLPNANIIGILEDNKSNLWLSTENGLVKFDPDKKSVQTYSISDGLAGNEFNYNSFFRDKRGEFFFGGFNGLTHFFPDRIETNSFKASLVFTGLKLFNLNVYPNGEDGLLKEDISFARSLTFKYNQDVFTIEFALLNFIKSSKNKYAYMLEGFDKKWNEVTSTSASYTNLPSGNYTFLVKGANNDGIWSEPAVLKVTILPPFWLTWWAYCLYAAVFGIILFLVIRFFFLRELLKKEEELHQVKLNFFTNISHEIRTHLTLIMAPVDQMLENKKQDDFMHQQLNNVKSNTNRLLRLVGELMDFRKAETNHLNLHVSQHNLIPFLQDIYDSFQVLSVVKDIKMSFTYDSREAFAYFDKGQLEKVFFNLLTNAFKFTPKGGRICMNVEQKGSNTIKITVIDNGRGIARQYREKLFTNFFQVADHGLQNTGYGIGLALSKTIVELHKGKIEVESEPGSAGQEGRTCFTITLRKGNAHFEGIPSVTQEPVFAIKPAEMETLAASSSSTSPDILNDEASTILIVEDNAELRLLIRQILPANYNVLECANGIEGLEMAFEQIPDLIISDVMMPEMDGFTLCKHLKTDERTSHIPVVLLTAKSEQADLVNGLETGADVYITKPFSAKALSLNIRNLLLSRERMRQKFSQQIVAVSQPEATSDEQITSSLINTVDKQFLNKVITLVEGFMDDPEFGVEMLSRSCAMSRPVLYKKIKALTGMSVNDFVKSLRLKKAATLLRQKQLTVNEICYAIGYNDRRYFTKEFKKQFDKTPSEYAGMKELEPENGND